MTDHGPEGKTLRLAKEGTRLEFKWGEEQPGDNTVSHDEKTVLVYDQDIAGLLSGRTLDVKETESGPALMLT
jgi:hypothetical protein